MNESRAPRQNRDGVLCPPWCETDHGKYDFHGSERIAFEAPRYRSCSARAIQYGSYSADPVIQVAAGGIVHVPPGEAEDLAALIEQLARVTPAQHRKLAAAIRQAADIITDATGGQR